MRKSCHLLVIQAALVMKRLSPNRTLEIPNGFSDIDRLSDAWGECEFNAEITHDTV